MPGFRGRQDPLLRLASSSGRRAPVPAGGIGISRVPRPADVSFGSAGTGIFGQLHWIDQWEITSAAVEVFETTFRPLPRSWNVTYNTHGQRYEVDYTVSGRDLTVVTAADLFANASVSFPGWLQIQYDYLIERVVTEYTEPTVVGIPWVRYPSGSTTRTMWFRLEGYSGTGSDITMAFDNSGGGITDTTGAGLAGGGYGSTIWTQALIRPWFDTTPPGGIRIEVGGVILYTTSDPITTNSGTPPTSYAG